MIGMEILYILEDILLSLKKEESKRWPYVSQFKLKLI